MHGRVDAHRHLVRILRRDALVHLEQVAVALADPVLAEALDRVGEVEIHAAATRSNAATVVARFLGRARRDIARREIAEAGVLPLEVVVAIGLGDVAGRLADVFLPLRHPHPPVVAQRLRHEREL
jgi:hypothetical protein